MSNYPIPFEGDFLHKSHLISLKWVSSEKILHPFPCPALHEATIESKSSPVSESGKRLF